MAEAIENKVDKSGLQTIDLGNFAPKEAITTFDIKDWLYQGLMLKEKDFRQYVKEHDWTQYQDQIVGVYCSTDAIVPIWAYMTIASKMTPYATKVYFGDRSATINQYFTEAIVQLDPTQYEDAKLVIKGCGDVEIPEGAFVKMTQHLQPYAKTIMYGEPCSTVPIYKKPRKRNAQPQGKEAEKTT